MAKDDENDDQDEENVSNVDKFFKRKVIKALDLRYLLTLEDKNLKIYSYLTRSSFQDSPLQPKIKFAYKPSQTIFGDISLMPYSTGSWFQITSTCQLTQQLKVKASINSLQHAKANFTYKNEIKKQNITLKGRLNFLKKHQFSNTWSMQILKKIYWKQQTKRLQKLISDISFMISKQKPEITLKTSGQFKESKSKLSMELKGRYPISSNNQRVNNWRKLLYNERYFLIEGHLKSQLQILNNTNLFGLTIKTYDQKESKIPIDFKYICRYFSNLHMGMSVKENLDYTFFISKYLKGLTYTFNFEKDHFYLSMRRKSDTIDFRIVTGINKFNYFKEWKFDGVKIKLQYNT